MAASDSDSPRKFDAVVVGNGVLGASAALVLARRGVSVARVGAAHRPFAASTAAGAMLGCFAEVTAAHLASPVGRKKLALAVEATARWEPWLASLGMTLPAAGTWVVDTDDALAPIEAAARMHHARFERTRDGAYAGRSLSLPDERWVDAPMLLASIDEAFARAGGVVVDDEVARVNADGVVRGVTLTSGPDLGSARVLLAAGAKTQPLLDAFPDVARRVPRITSGFGESIVVETRSTVHGVVRTANRPDGSSLHVVPRGPTTVYIGATNIALASPRASASDDQASDALLGRAAAAFADGLEGARIVTRHAGNRPMSADGLPIAGATSLDGLFLLTGTQRDGLHLSPLLAEAIAATMFGARDERLEPFTPERA